MPKTDMQRRQFELTVATIRLLMWLPMHARSSPASGRSPSSLIYDNTTREGV